MITIKLQCEHGRLWFPTGHWRDATQPSLLYRRYDAGDVDTCRWPLETDHDKVTLAYALYDERETNGTWPSNDIVQIELPDGTIFDGEHLVK